MTVFARVLNGLVVQFPYSPPAGATMSQCWPADVLSTWIDVTAALPQPQEGWSATQTQGVWSFSPPAAPAAPTLAQQAMTAMGAGLTLVSTGAPALDGTYPCDASTQSHLQAEMIALLNSGGATFADGTTSVVWPDLTGTNHTFNATQFKAFALAVGAYVAALFKCINGTLGALPAATATIA